jgi:hypothetical protein
MNSSRRLTGNSFVAKRIPAGLMLVLAGCVMVACSNSVAPEETDFTVSFGRIATTAAPDSIYWTFSGASGAIAAAPNQTAYSIPVHVSGRSVHKDTLKLDLRILSIATYHVRAWAGIDYPQIDIFDKAPDSIANRLLIQYDSISQKDVGHHPWTHLGVQAFYADQLFSGNLRFTGYPKNCPNGMDTLAIDSLILSRLLDSKDSVGRHLGDWGLNWTPDQVKSVYRRWLGTGHLLQGQYDTLYPFDDRPPTTTRKLVFTGTADTTTILRGGDAVKLEGAFADDTGIVGLSIRILSTPGDVSSDATSKFVLDTAAFPAAPQKTWDLAGRYSIKTTTAPNGPYQLQMILRDRKGQADTATYNFSVHQPGGVAIDSIAPSITPVLPATLTLTVEDTVKSYLVRFSVRDENLKIVVLDEDTVHPVNGIVEKTVPLVEGQTVTIRIFAADSSKNSSSDSVQITRKVAVPPKLTRIHPASGRDSVSDTTYTYSFRWQVDGIDIDSIAIDTFGVLLDNQKIAEKTLPLKLGGTTHVKIRVVDKLRHIAIDSLDVVRSASVPPAIARVGLPAGLVTVPDTQAYYTANWTVSDNNLQTVSVLGQTAAISDGGYGAKVFLKAGDTARLPVWAQDKLGSISTDTVKVWRPDPRTPYLADIAAAQHGDSVVALTDFVLPNVRFGRFEVTADLYAKVMKLAAPTTPGLPMVNVNIYDAMLFCNAMSKAAGLDTFYTYSTRDAASGYLADFDVRSDTATGSVIRNGFRLPTGREWDALAASWGGAYPWGSSLDTLIVRQYATWNTSSDHQVGQLQPTAHGVFDLAGNAGEWVYQNHGNTDLTTRWYVRGGDFTSATPTDLGSVDFVQDGKTGTGSVGFRVIRTGKN